MINVPKSELIKIILNQFSDKEIRLHFSIKENTNITTRLNSYKKGDLLYLI